MAKEIMTADVAFDVKSLSLKQHVRKVILSAIRGNWPYPLQVFRHHKAVVMTQNNFAWKSKLKNIGKYFPT